MKESHFSIIACRLLAIYWFVVSLNTLSNLFLSVASFKTLTEPDIQNQTTYILFLSIIPSVFQLTAALILWFGANRIAKVILPNSPTSEPESPITLEAAQAAAFSVIGIFILCTTIPELSAGLYKTKLLKQYDYQANFFSDNKIHFLKLFVKLTLGTLLLFGARGLSGLVMWLRNLGHNK